MREVDLLLDLLDQAFDHKAWHGTNLKGSLRGLSAALATWRPAADRHCVAEIALHAAYWKYAITRRLTHAKRGSFALSGSNWFAVPEDLDERTWRDHLGLLVAAHKELRSTVAALDPARLDQVEAGSRHTVGELVRGVALHDVYHAGQVQVLKALWKGRDGGTL